MKKPVPKKFVRDKKPRPRMPGVVKDIKELLSTLPDSDEMPNPPSDEDLEVAKRLAHGESAEKVWEEVYKKPLAFDPELAKQEVMDVLGKKAPGAFYRMMNANADPSREDFTTWLKAHIMASIKEGKEPFTQGQSKALDKYMKAKGWGNETRVLKMTATASSQDMAEMERKIEATIRK